MKQILLLSALTLSLFFTSAQAPVLVKSVGGTVMEPSGEDQKRWQNNYWNGMFFYQGKGAPSKLCVTDGTEAGTKFITNLGNGGFHAVLPAKDFVYIITSELVSFSPFTYKYEIWRTDGTVAGTNLIMTPPNAVGLSNASSFYSDQNSVFNYSLDGTTNNLYFSAYDAVNGNELWISDGTSAGTHLLKDIKPGTGGSFPWGFMKIGNEVYFNCAEIGLERKLWKTDGTATGTVKVNVAEPFFIVNGNISKLGNKMIFFAHNTVDGYEPYVSDGTAAGTFMLGNINPSGNSYLATVQEANFKSNSKHCFMVLQNGTDTALWRTDGTISGTIRLSANNLYHGVSSGGYCDVDENGLWLLQYNASGLGNSENLYKSDGTPAGTYLVASNLSFAQKIKIYKNAAWFQARDIGSVANTEVWRSGGNAAVTNKSFEIEPAIVPVAPFTPYSSEPYGFFVQNNKLYFFAKKSLPLSSVNLYQYTGNFTFNGNLAGGQWKDSANWNGLMPPGITDTVYVNAGTPNTLNITAGNAYAGTLILGNNAVINITNTTDSIIINKEIAAGANNNFTGNGVLALKNTNADSAVVISNGFAANQLAALTAANLQSGNITVANNLNLTNNSLFSLNNNNLTLTGTTSTITQNGNSYINTNGTGKLTIENIGGGGRTGAIIFPVGNTGNYNPVSFTNTGTADNFSVRVQPQVFAAYTGETGAGAYTTAAVNATWFITEAVAGGSIADITLQWNAAQELPAFDRSMSRFGHYTSSWQLGTTAAATGTNPYTFAGTGITSFSPFGVLNNAGTLPLQFIQFTAQKCNNNTVCVNWQTANEINVSHFVIERSADAQTYIAVATVTAQNRTANSYSFSDDIAMLQYSNKIYYRIKQVDKDGRFTGSNIVFITNSNDVSVSVYPNPAASALFIHGYEKTSVVQVFNMAGNKMLEQQAAPFINISGLAAGNYIIKLLSKTGDSILIRFVKQ